jgi:hypothetical protein
MDVRDNIRYHDLIDYIYSGTPPIFKFGFNFPYVLWFMNLTTIETGCWFQQGTITKVGWKPTLNEKDSVSLSTSAWHNMAWFPIPCSFGRASYLTQFLRWLALVARALYDVISVTHVKLYVLANATKILNWCKGLIQSTYTLQYLYSRVTEKTNQHLQRLRGMHKRLLYVIRWLRGMTQDTYTWTPSITIILDKLRKPRLKLEILCSDTMLSFMHSVT